MISKQKNEIESLNKVINEYQNKNKNLIDGFDIKIYKNELIKHMEEIIKLKESEENLKKKNKELEENLEKKNKESEDIKNEIKNYKNDLEEIKNNFKNLKLIPKSIEDKETLEAIKKILNKIII